MLVTTASGCGHPDSGDLDLAPRQFQSRIGEADWDPGNAPAMQKDRTHTADSIRRVRERHQSLVWRPLAPGMEKDLDSANHCTAEFVADVCKYWLGEPSRPDNRPDGSYRRPRLLHEGNWSHGGDVFE